MGLTPPTMFVPYSMACWLWKVPVLPVKPWQITLVCLKTAGGGALACELEAQRRVLSTGREVCMCMYDGCAAHRHLPRELPQRQPTMPLRREHVSWPIGVMCAVIKLGGLNVRDPLAAHADERSIQCEAALWHGRARRGASIKRPTHRTRQLRRAVLPPTITLHYAEHSINRITKPASFLCVGA